MWSEQRGATGGECVLQTLRSRGVFTAGALSLLLEFVRIVTDSLRRASPAVAFVLGVIGTSVATALYLSQSVSGVVALILAAHALASMALALVVGAKAPPAKAAATVEATPAAAESSPAAAQKETHDEASQVASEASTPELRDPLTGLASRTLLRDRVE